MSRIGFRAIPVPAGVTVNVDEATNVVTVKGPKGTLTQPVSRLLTLSQPDGHVEITRANDLREAAGSASRAGSMAVACSRAW